MVPPAWSGSWTLSCRAGRHRSEKGGIGGWRVHLDRRRQRDEPEALALAVGKAWIHGAHRLRRADRENGHSGRSSPAGADGHPAPGRGWPAADAGVQSRSAAAGDSSRGGHLVRDERRPPEEPRRRMRRLHHEANRHAAVPARHPEVSAPGLIYAGSIRRICSPTRRRSPEVTAAWPLTRTKVPLALPRSLTTREPSPTVMVACLLETYPSCGTLTSPVPRPTRLSPTLRG